MWYETVGDHSGDPLYIMLAREDEDAAEEYAANQDSDIIQRNLIAERERGSIDFGTSPFSVEEESMIMSATSDEAIEMLVAFLKEQKK